MDEKAYRMWLEQEKDYNTARTYAARCFRIENDLKINLDQEYISDQGKSLMERLKYSKDEFRNMKQPKCGIVLNPKTNMYSCMNSLRVSVKKYFEFKTAQECK